MGTVDKFVDGDFVNRLLDQSFEILATRVDEAVAKKSELFGGGRGTDVRTLGTFANHAIVANSKGEFFRASYTTEADGTVVLDEVEVMDVPVHEASDIVGRARVLADKAVESLMAGDAKGADSALVELSALVGAGVRLTAESVSEEIDAIHGAKRAWRESVTESLRTIEQFLGPDLRGTQVPKPKFETLVSEGSGDPRHRKLVVAALREARSFVGSLLGRMALARQIDESYQFVGGASLEGGMATVDFLDLVSEVSEDLERTEAALKDAVAVAEDGEIRTLARIHDTVASGLYEVTAAALFAERFARTFVPPQAA